MRRNTNRLSAVVDKQVHLLLTADMNAHILVHTYICVFNHR